MSDTTTTGQPVAAASLYGMGADEEYATDVHADGWAGAPRAHPCPARVAACLPLPRCPRLRDRRDAVGWFCRRDGHRTCSLHNVDTRERRAAAMIALAPNAVSPTLGRLPRGARRPRHRHRHLGETQELADTTPFSENCHDLSDRPGACAAVLPRSRRDRRRLESSGRRSSAQWHPVLVGAFDFAVMLFNGKHDMPPDDRGYIMRYDLDAEMMNAGSGGRRQHAEPRLLRVLSRGLTAVSSSHRACARGLGRGDGRVADALRGRANVQRSPQAILDFLGSVYRVATTRADGTDST